MFIRDTVLCSVHAASQLLNKARHVCVCLGVIVYMVEIQTVCVGVPFYVCNNIHLCVGLCMYMLVIYVFSSCVNNCPVYICN